MQKIYILWLRQVKKYLRSRSRIIGALGQPIIFLLALGFGFGPIFEKAGGGSYIQFLAPGVIAMSILFTAMFAGIEVIWDKQIGFLKETLVAPVSRSTIMVGRTLGGATASMIQGLIVFIITLFVGFRPVSFGLMFVAFVVMFLIALLFTALGTAIASRLEDMQGFTLIMNFLIMPVFFLSGALFPIAGLSKTMSVVTSIDPLTYGVDALHGALSYTSHFGLGLDLLVLTGITALVLVIGTYEFSKIEI